MRVRVVLQFMVVLFAAAVGGVIWWNWQPSQLANSGADGVEIPRPRSLEQSDEPEEREFASFTDAIQIRNTNNGRDIFTIWADEQIDFADGWNTWSRVRVLIHGKEGTDDDIEIRSDRARTTGAEGSTGFNQVVFIGDVVATLPSGGEFTTRRIDYDAITGEVSNCNRNTLQYAGLEVRADCMEFQTAGEVIAATAVAEELRMWGDLTIRTGESEGEGGMPGGMQGTATELRFTPGGEAVRLSGEPSVNLETASIRGDELILDVGANADELRGVLAEGKAYLRLRPAGSTDSAAADDDATVGTQNLEADRIDMALGGESGVESVLAQGTNRRPASLSIGGLGSLSAREVEIVPAEGRLSVRATDSVVWQPRRDTGPLRDLTAGDLRLGLENDGIESLDAAGGVLATLVAVDGRDRAFSGGRLVLGWVGGELRRGAWPEGISLSLDGRTLDAEHATLAPDSGAWELGGTAPTRIAAPEFDFQAAEMSLHPDGRIDAGGGVTGTIGGQYLSAAGALFGDVEAVQMKSASARVERDGDLRLLGGVEVVWTTQSLIANDLLLESDPGRLRARGDVELVALARLPEAPATLTSSAPDPETVTTDTAADAAASDAGTAGAGEDDAAATTEGAEVGAGQYITVSAEDLLVEQVASEVRIAGKAELRQSGRRIAADSMVVQVDEDGQWSSVLAEGDVEFEEDRARGTGIALEYSLANGDLRLTGDEDDPAVFVYSGVDPPAEYRSDEELRVSYAGDGIVIESTEDGRATTSVVQPERQSR